MLRRLANVSIFGDERKNIMYMYVPAFFQINIQLSFNRTRLSKWAEI